MATAKPSKTAAKKATKKAAPAKKAPAKKAAAKKATKKAAPAAKRVTREIPAKRAAKPAGNGSFQRLADSASSFTAQVGKTAGAFAHTATDGASHLASQARDKAKSSVSKTRQFIKDHPGEAAALATAGLTVAAAVLGRKRVGGLAKAAAAAGLASKANDIGKKGLELANKLKAHLKS